MLDKQTRSWINLHVIIKLLIWLWLCYMGDMIWPGWLHRSGSWKCEQDRVQTVCWWRSEASSESQGFRALRPPLHPTLHLQQWAQRGPLLGVADLHPTATHCQSQEERINHQWTQTLDVFTKGGKRKLKRFCCSICCLLAQTLHLVMSSGIGRQSNLFSIHPRWNHLLWFPCEKLLSSLCATSSVNSPLATRSSLTSVRLILKVESYCSYIFFFFCVASQW